MNARRRLAWWTGAASAIALLAFVANVVIGKIALDAGRQLATPLDGVPEFILLLFAVAMFMTRAMLLSRDPPESG